MATVRFDETRFPLVVIYLESSLSRDDAVGLYDGIGAILDRGRRFALLVVNSRSDEKRQPGAARVQKRWAKSNKERMSAHCAGIAYVLDSRRLVTIWKPITERVIRATVGCPGAVFANQEEATQWLAGRLEATKT